ncbi:probable udp-n-acetylglucosamine--peptide n-acetylglucosaminyltransferase sec-like [Plasmopara halstedii]|uniref:protein O-GlcNAc transferase n=1 Tax=Plasmopara halstedii TaxID=4781 RepID=A0A0P1B620_PLAHL|nr:probable udp-n-acetylglucosamine--peptide n-acetylglucosaminyltransferase sec-like [Plasmopara halstedii]CEG49920.1 probable udp-n-acetylglucosamine--peptide n-acetylglucosaminyltransferase sec-like [Plasmopara halstedii]|eukprot:XP_024586289.1 probable udp-n-acetylglucosamine--peptide n-acetylglucosaminyltransferase sec-like [Plasmopara halstedii]
MAFPTEMVPFSTICNSNRHHERFTYLFHLAHEQYLVGSYSNALRLCNELYASNASRPELLLLLGALHFQLGNFSHCIAYNQQCIRLAPTFAEAYGNLGNALKELGDLSGAIQFYLRAIKVNPNFRDAYNQVANCYMVLGQTEEAVEMYQLVLEYDPELVEAQSNLGNLYKLQGRREDAKECYCQALRLNPKFAIAWSNLAGLMKEEGQVEAAIEYYQEAIRYAPEFADAYSNLGNVLKEMNRLKEAIEAYQAAVTIRPTFAIAYGNLASCYYEAGDFELAISTFRHAIELEGNFPDAYNNLGNALRECGELEQAIDCYRTALQLKPDHPHAYNNLGNALKDKGLIKEALQCYTIAIRFMPQFAAAHSNIGSILKEQGKFDQALAHYQEAISIDPKFADAYSNMGNVFKDLYAYSNLASAYKDGGRLEEAIGFYRKALTLRPHFPEAFANYFHSLVFICDWKTRQEDTKKLQEFLDEQLQFHDVVPAVQPFHALVYPLSMQCFQAISTRYAERAKLNVSLVEIPRCRVLRNTPVERLRIGYVSSDLGNHPLAHLMQSVFGFHNKKEFEIFCYATSPDDGSKWRQEIVRSVEQFHDISTFTTEEAVRTILNDQIHLLINLNGYTKGARNEIFALQPAPLQISYMGFCGTLGAEYIQYMIGDAMVVPVSSRQYFTEKIIQMPHTYFVNDHKQSAQEVLDTRKCPTRADYGVPDDYFVFCNFNQVYKIDPVTFTTWMNILQRVPNSILWLLRFPPIAEENIRAEARARGIFDDSRLLFTDVAPKDEHLKRGYLADLFLDTPECNAHTTGCDILWGGTPMITMPQDRMATRVAASLLRAANLSELITTSLEEYEELAVALATDRKRLATLRRRLETERLTCPLFDTKRWVRNLEIGYSMIWARYENGYEPDHIEVPDIQDLLRQNQRHGTM